MPDHQAKYSIVMPVRNGANYLERTLKSIFAQTYTDFELIILENCSQDNTVEIIRSFNDPRVKIVPAPEPLSIEENWKRMITLELNEYLVLQCHDDPLLPEFLQEINDLIEKHPDASLYHTYFDYVDEHDRPFKSSLPAPYRETADEFLFNAHSFREDFLGTGYVMRSADFKRVGGYPMYPKLLFADGFCYYELARLSYKICSPRRLYHFTRHPDSAGHTSRLAEFCQSGLLYIRDLAASTHFDVPERKSQTYTFLIGFFIRPQYRRLLAATIKMRRDRQQKLEECRKAQQVMDETHAQDPLFQVRNRTTRLYEAVNRIDWYPARLAAYAALDVSVNLGVRLVHGLRDWRQTPTALTESSSS